MTWKLWLDDQLDDPNTPNRHVPEGFTGARSTAEALHLIHRDGLPGFMDLDHDLGGSDTCMLLLQILINHFPYGPVPEYRVHSENPVGRDNIVSLMESWKNNYMRPSPVRDRLGELLGGIEVADFFVIRADQMEKIRVFQEEHVKLHGKYAGAIGGRFTYTFTGTSLGMITRCECGQCGKYADVSDYDDW